MTVSSYSTTASSNTAINGVNISEGMSPSDVNNAIREQLVDVRSVWNDKEWFILGDADGTTTFTRASSTSITVASNVASTHHVGRRVKIVGSNSAQSSRISFELIASGMCQCIKRLTRAKPEQNSRVQTIIRGIITKNCGHGRT